MTATSKQISYIKKLAADAGFSRYEFAVMQVTGQSISNQQRKGVTAQAASEVIDGLLDGTITPES